jgi:hypothetical protein
MAWRVAICAVLHSAQFQACLSLFPGGLTFNHVFEGFLSFRAFFLA